MLDGNYLYTISYAYAPFDLNSEMCIQRVSINSSFKKEHMRSQNVAENNYLGLFNAVMYYKNIVNQNDLNLYLCDKLKSKK